MIKKRFTLREEAIIIDMVKKGSTNKEIADVIGRTESSVANKRYELVCKSKDSSTAAEELAPAGEPTAPVKQKTLDDYTVREMIKNLFGRGVRIRVKDGKYKIVLVTETELLLNDIIR